MSTVAAEMDDLELEDEFFSELLQLDLPELTAEEQCLLDSVMLDSGKQQVNGGEGESDNLSKDLSLEELFQLPNIDLSMIPILESDVPGSALPEDMIGKLVPSGSVEIFGQQIPVLVPIASCSSLEDLVALPAGCGLLEDKVMERDILMATHPLLPQVNQLLAHCSDGCSSADCRVECGVLELDRVMQEAVCKARQISTDKRTSGVMEMIDKESKDILGEVSCFCKNLLDSCDAKPGKENSRDNANTIPATLEQTSKKKISSQATQILRSWLFEHALKPYPDEDEKDELCLQTGLNITQLNNWFVNARRRVLPSYLKEKCS